MNFCNVLSGKNIPEDIFVIIEISSNSNPVKYEIEKKTGILFVNRFINTKMLYPCNYGYINNTLSLDNDPLDVVVIAPYSLNPGSVIQCNPIGILKMIDESGDDFKIIGVPHSSVTTEYETIKDILDLSNNLKDQIIHFFTHYKDLEKGKWTKILGWDNSHTAKKEIVNSIERYINSLKK
ncbi:inorganic pyrophosphatase [Buchnera aphidicola (Nipponaphis monzeni)]|uniref:Inorganic pyrophosphatase n=1 Tax=Buchnera aphidicola (Nipponaphis monzeni) TaxID=2495405 RepID=A0A455T9R9_9GAMM|nr:inorganic diphosphatase [Buchnera aphidicola]BBI01088.1 inorganic pyrophosphatase [Buchnera aphidicola (Nipponaphis monzeni)]